MNDNSFDKFFDQKKLDSAQIFSFNESRWQKMDRLIESTQSKKRWRRLLWLLLIPLLLFTGLITWGGWELHESKNRVNELALELKKMNEQVSNTKQNNFNYSEGASVTTFNDTIFKKYVVVLYDTIYKTILSIKEANSYPGSISEIPLNQDKKSKMTTEFIPDSSEKADKIAYKYKTDSNLMPYDTALTGRVHESLISSYPEIYKVNKDNVVSEKVRPVWDIQPIYKRALHPIQYIKFTPIRWIGLLDEKSLDKKSDKQHNHWLPTLKPIILSGFELGLSGGMALSFNVNNPNQTGYNLGGQGALLLGKRFKIVGALQSLELGYKLEQVNGTQNIPVISPPSSNDVFKQVQIRKPYLNYSIGLQYEFLENRFKPYLGISALAQSKQEEKFEFLFKNKITGEDVIIRTNRNENSFHWPSLRLHAGIKYVLYDNLHMALEGTYDAKIFSQNWYNPLWQLKGGIVYRFNSVDR